MTVGAETHAKLRRAQDLLRHVVPNGDPSVIFDRALTVLLEELQRRRCGTKKERSSTSFHPSVRKPATAGEKTDHNSPKVVPERVGQRSAKGTARTRYVPAMVRREVWTRDGGRCTFVGPDGNRCTQTGFLEYHHVVPLADGGPTTTDNVRLTCRPHNNCEAERRSST
jgi:5-methylcytosine-specific restriction endonuclease McrA